MCLFSGHCSPLKYKIQITPMFITLLNVNIYIYIRIKWNSMFHWTTKVFPNIRYPHPFGVTADRRGGGRTCYYCNVVTQYTGEPAGRDHRDPRLLGRRREKTRVVRIITVIKMKYRGVMSSRRGRSARTE